MKRCIAAFLPIVVLLSAFVVNAAEVMVLAAASLTDSLKQIAVN